MASRDGWREALCAYTGPPTSLIGTGYVADHILYTEQTDASIMDLGDGTAHISNTDTNPLWFGWHQNTKPRPRRGSRLRWH
jgi:hypothetical protein